jgi:RNA polymerase sigma factor (sigma-70 family)
MTDFAGAEPTPIPATGARVLEAAATDAVLFEAFYERAWAPAVRLAVALIGDRARAEELAQDAFEKVLLRWDALANPDAYLTRCVVNAGRSEQRWRRRRTREPLVENAATPAPGRELLDALSTLTPRRRTALICRFYLDLDDAEIARLLHVRPASVRSLVFRGLDDLRKVLPDA